MTADRVVAADAEPEQEPEPDQHPEGPGQRRADRPDDHDRRDQPVHPLAADHVRVAPEHQRAAERGGQHRAVQHGQVRRAELPVLRDQRRGDPDDEQVVGVGEEAHPGGQHRPHVGPAKRRLVQRRNQVSGLDILHHITPQIIRPHRHGRPLGPLLRRNVSSLGDAQPTCT
jgi:hypothetical protein